LIRNGYKFAFLLLVMGFMTYAFWEMRDFGDPSGDVELGDTNDGKITLYDPDGNITIDRTVVDDYYLDHSQLDPDDGGASANNPVTAIVFDYRGFDTLGEGTVLFTAVSGVLVTLRVAFKKEDKGEKGPKRTAGGDAV